MADLQRLQPYAAAAWDLQRQHYIFSKFASNLAAPHQACFSGGHPFALRSLTLKMSSLHEEAVKRDKEMPTYKRSHPKHADYEIIILQYACRVFTPVKSKLT